MTKDKMHHMLSVPGMKFIVVQHTKDDIIIKGNWLPKFCQRVIPYTDTIPDMDAHIENLRKDIFKNDDDVVVTPNEYPYYSEIDSVNLIGWVNEKFNNFNLEWFQKYVDQVYPNKDYLIWINSPENRSIKSIEHCHILLANPQPKRSLRKLTVFIRHGDREPIMTLKKYQIELTENGHHGNAQLTENGKKTARKIARQIKEIYQFWEIPRYATSPVSRCVDTINAIREELGNNEIEEDERLHFYYKEESYKKEYSCSPESKYFRQKYKSLFKKLKEEFDFEHDYLIELYSLYSSLRCYYEAGYNLDNELDLFEELMGACREICNAYAKYMTRYFNDHLYDIVDAICSYPDKIRFFCTHDHFIFQMAHCLMKVNGLNFDLELPEYCSNIRVEEWDDGYRRIFFNNYFIGHKLS
jgi:hypothetical protein